MPTIYKKKNAEKHIDEDAMAKAIEEIRNKTETPSSASKKYNLKRTTILSRMSKNNENISSKFHSKYSSQQILTITQERELKDYFIKCSNLHHGLSYDLAKKFVYEFVCTNKIKHPSSWDVNKQSGKDWLKGFMNRNSEISLRKPENTSLARLRGFTQSAVDCFFNNLKSLYQKHNFQAHRIYNLDETGISTVLEAPKVSLPDVSQMCCSILINFLLNK